MFDAIRKTLHCYLFFVDVNGSFTYPIQENIEEVMLVQTQAVPSATPKSLMFHKNCHISYLTTPIKVCFSILEIFRHKLLITYGHTHMIPSLNTQGPHPHQDHMGPLTNGATSPGCHYGVPFVPMVLRELLMEKKSTLINFFSRLQASMLFIIFATSSKSLGNLNKTSTTNFCNLPQKMHLLANLAILDGAFIWALKSRTQVISHLP